MRLLAEMKAKQLLNENTEILERLKTWRKCIVFAFVSHEALRNDFHLALNERLVDERRAFFAFDVKPLCTAKLISELQCSFIVSLER
jgi:hypothetical protein